MLNAIKANNMITFGYFNRYMPVQNPSSYSLNISCRHCALDSTNQNQPAKIHQQLSQGKILRSGARKLCLLPFEAT